MTNRKLRNIFSVTAKTLWAIMCFSSFLWVWYLLFVVIATP